MAEDGQTPEGQTPTAAQGEQVDVAPAPADGPPATIPYGRFQEVNSDKKAIQEKLEATEAQLAEAMQIVQTAAYNPPQTQTTPGVIDEEDEVTKLINQAVQKSVSEAMGPVTSKIEKGLDRTDHDAFWETYKEATPEFRNEVELGLANFRAKGVDVTRQEILRYVLGSRQEDTLKQKQETAAAVQTQVLQQNQAAQTASPASGQPEEPKQFEDLSSADMLKEIGRLDYGLK